MNQTLRDELIAMKEHDLAVRARLAAEGSLFEGYHPEMEAVHRRNAARLSRIMDDVGWPGSSLVGGDGAEAAWLIAQHAIGEPGFQRRCLESIHAAVEAAEVPAWHAAYLEDRIRVFEGRKQLYGTQFDSGPGGEPVPCPIEDPDRVDERRQAVGLESLARRMETADRVPPMDEAERARWQRNYEAWLRRAGWRS